jgi:hypothetical protein
MSSLYETGGKFPWVHKHTCPTFKPVLVIMPDGRLGVVDHVKTDGNLGVRPISDKGEFFLNPSPYWTLAQKQSIPEEVALPPSAVRPPHPSELPARFR